MGRRSDMAVAALLALAWPGAARAAGEITVEATVDASKVVVGEVVSLQVRAQAHVNGDIRITVPKVEGVTELSRSRSEGTSISWGSGGQQVTKEQKLFIELQIDAPGTYRIGPVTAQVGAFAARSAPVTVKAYGQAEIAADAEAVAPGEVAPPDPKERTLFARYRLSKSRAYLGEQVLLDLEIFAAPRGNFNLEEVPSPPELDGFWTKVLYKPERLKRRTERIGGAQYHVYRLWRVALFGLEATERTLPPIRVGYARGGGFFRSGQRTRVRTKPVTLTIDPLPTAGRPSGFVNTNVGQLALTARLDQSQVPAGKAVVLTVALQGKGNLQNVKLPELGDIDGFRVFPPTIDSELNAQLSGLTGKKTAEILLMPTRGGRLEVPSLSLPIFDPEEDAYRVLSTPTLRVAVQGEPTAPAAAAPAPATPKKAQAELSPIVFRSDLTPRDAPPFASRAYLAAVGALPLLFLLTLLAERIFSRARRPSRSKEKRAVAKAARARLDAAAAAARAGQVAEAYARFAEALFEIGSDRLAVSLQGLTTDGIVEALAAQGASPELQARVRTELETADYARFAPGAVRDPADGAVDRWAAILDEVEALEGARS